MSVSRPTRPSGTAAARLGDLGIISDTGGPVDAGCRRVAGGEGVHPDAVWAPFDSQALGEGFDAGFAHATMDPARIPGVWRRAGDVEHGTSASASDQPAPDGLAHVERSERVRLNHGSKAVGREVLGSDGESGTSVVDEDADGAEGLLRRRHHGFHGGRIPYVADHGLGAAAGAANRGGRRLETLQSTAGHYNGCAASGQPRGDSLTKTATAPSDDRRGAREEVGTEWTAREEGVDVSQADLP